MPKFYPNLVGSSITLLQPFRKEWERERDRERETERERERKRGVNKKK